MEHVSIDKDQFQRRLQRLKAAWTWPLDAIVVVLGKSDDASQEFKSSAMHFWLFGIEFPETVVGLLKSGKAIFLTSQKKLEYLRQIEGPGVVLMPRGTGTDGDQPQFKAFADALREGKERAAVGALLKEKHVGPFAQAFSAALSSLPGLQIAECKEELATLLAPKEEQELQLASKSARCAQQALQSVFLKKLEDVIDMDLRKSNKQVCDEVEQQFEDQELMKSWEQKLKVDPQEMELVYASLQSGQSFEIKPAVPPTDEEVPMQGTYLLSIGMKYTEYSSCVARTLFVDPTAIQKEAYGVLLEVHQLVLDSLKPDAVFRDIYLAAKARVQEKRPDLVEKFVKSVGFVMGLEFRDTLLMLSEKCERRVTPGMVFCISVGFAETGASRWATWLADTVIVPLRGGACEVPTSACTTKVTDVMYELDEGGNAEPPPPPPAPREASKAAKPQEEKRPAAKGKAKAKAAAATPAPERRPSRGSTAERAKRPSAASASRGEEQRPSSRQEERPEVNPGNIVQSRTRARNVQTKQDMGEQARLETQQLSLRRQKLEELKQRFAANRAQQRGSGSGRPAGAKKLHELEAYASIASLPAVQPNRVELDASAEVLLVPIRGAVVPFHVSTIKNMARSTMDRFEFLRVNFFTPGQGKPAEDFPQVNGRRIYLKELSFRSQAKDNFDAIVRGFKEVQKRARQRELEGEVKRSSSAQEHVPLQLLRPRCPTLRDLCMRPTYGSSARRTVGNLEAHVNGFRFSMKGGAEKVDILYSQLSHVIYEPCEKGSLIVLIHFHLKDAFMLGKKKTQDVQFFTEVTAQTEDLSIRKAGNMHDPDEIFEEQREREMKERLNKLFLDFSKEVERISTFPHAFDMPFKPLSFSGVPHKAVVTLTPCKGALVALQEWPPFCLSLSEVDIVVFERAIMTLREFDIVFVKRDYEQSPIRITTIPTANMDTIKRWLGDIQAVWYSCSMNMQWAMVMKEVNKDTRDFVENGGWDPWFAGNAASDSGEEDDDESDFDASGVDDGDDSDAGDDDDDDFSAEPDEDSSDPASEEESGMSWDELEKEAERADRKRDLDKGDHGGGRSKQPPRKSARKR